MIYNNLFKPNKAHATKKKIFYLRESRKYKFSLIFDKKFNRILIALIGGTVMICVVNLGIYWGSTYVNQKKIEVLEVENQKFESAIGELEKKQKEYNSQKTNVDNIYNLSDKPTKWSSIIQKISEQLPYDSTLTDVETITSSEMNEATKSANNSSNTTTNSNQNNTSNNSNNSNNSNSNNTNGTTTNDNNASANTNASNTTTQSATNANSNQGSSQEDNSDIVTNNVILIKGNSLSMVNISLFLDKLDKLELFSKVECTKAEKNKETSIYEFVIYAILN